MAVAAAVVSVTTSATKLNTAESDYARGHSLLVSPASTVYVGGSNVTTGAGFPVTSSLPLSFDLASGEDLYAIASGTVAVNVLQTGV